MPTPFQLPRLTNPERYQGFYAVHFPHGVSVGYTLEEIQILLAEPEYASAQVYRVHRVDDQGNIELAGITPRDLTAQETILFASTDPNRATEDFSAVRNHAATHPCPCPAQIELIDLPEQPYPHAVCLTYPASSSPAVSTWLQAVESTGDNAFAGGGRFSGGDSAIGGQEAATLRRSVPSAPIASAILPSGSRQSPRTLDQLLASIHDPIQR